MKKNIYPLLLSLSLLFIFQLGWTQDSEPPLPSGLGGSDNQDSSSEPPLPSGLGGDETSDEPALPQGLGGDDSSQEPDLPQGLGTRESEEVPVEEEEVSWFEDQELLGFPIHGFWEVRAGMRTQNDPYHSSDLIMGESRLQLETTRAFEDFTFDFTGDVFYDQVDHEWETDLRGLNVSFTPLDFIDVRVGRQILTWGTGDLLFINDMFPKDWQSFFIGRDVEYLKAPSDSVRLGIFTDIANINFVYTPQFDSDRFISGERVSYWNGNLGRRAGEHNRFGVSDPNDWFSDDEFAYRIYRTISSYEVALYGYHGYWKTPGGMDPAGGYGIFPELNTYGASLRGNALAGIGNIEVGYYDSVEDRAGTDPFINNSELRFLIGYEQELWTDFTAAVQYYLEFMMDYNDYHASLPPGSRPRDEDRHVLTLRLTQLLLNQDLELSYFSYFSPSDEDVYIRLNASYKMTDDWQATIGSNIFLGEEDHTFFGQFERNTNVYASLRYSF